MFKLKLNKIKANEWRTYTGYQTELIRGHVFRIKGDEEVWVIDQVVTDKRSGLSTHYMRKVLDRSRNSDSLKVIPNGAEYRIIGQQ